MRSFVVFSLLVATIYPASTTNHALMFPFGATVYDVIVISMALDIIVRGQKIHSTSTIFFFSICTFITLVTLSNWGDATYSFRDLLVSARAFAGFVIGYYWVSGQGNLEALSSVRLFLIILLSHFLSLGLLLIPELGQSAEIQFYRNKLPWPRMGAYSSMILIFFSVLQLNASIANGRKHVSISILILMLFLAMVHQSRTELGFVIALSLYFFGKQFNVLGKTLIILAVFILLLFLIHDLPLGAYSRERIVTDMLARNRVFLGHLDSIPLWKHLFGVGLVERIYVPWLQLVDKNTVVLWFDGNFQMMYFRFGVLGLIFWTSMIIFRISNLKNVDSNKKTLAIGSLLFVLTFGVTVSFSFNYTAVIAGMIFGLGRIPRSNRSNERKELCRNDRRARLET